jgi:hypothetical protein
VWDEGFEPFCRQSAGRHPENVPSGKNLVSEGSTPYRTVATDQYSLSRQLLPTGSEAAYLQFWKGWWSANQATLAPPAQ